MRLFALVAVILATVVQQSAAGVVVRVAPVVVSVPSTAIRVIGLSPPASVESLPPNSTFWVELWASNTGAPLGGLACVYADLTFSTAVVDAVPVEINSPLFPLLATTAVFDEVGGIVAAVGGCQTAPAISDLGLGEWVLVKRLEFSATDTGVAEFSLLPSSDPFAATSIVGELFPVNDVDIDFGSQTVLWGMNADVPTASFWAILSFALLILIGGTVVFPRTGARENQVSH